jgi:hypothetical protein
LPTELLNLIFTHLFQATHLTIEPDHVIESFIIKSDPPLKPVLLTCRAFRREAIHVARRAIRSVLWDFDSHDGGMVGRRRWKGNHVRRRGEEKRGQGLRDYMEIGIGLLNSRRMLAPAVMRGVREVEVCVPAEERLCGRCAVRWLEELIGSWEAIGLERVLLRIGVRKVCIGQWVRLVDGVQKREVVEHMLGCWREVKRLEHCTEDSSTESRRVRVLIEVGLTREVSMSCLGRVEECGERCFEDNFMVRNFSICDRCPPS